MSRETVLREQESILVRVGGTKTQGRSGASKPPDFTVFIYLFIIIFLIFNFFFLDFTF